jgi:hypothetical protein
MVMVKRMLKEVISSSLPMGWLTKVIAGALIAAIFAWGGQWIGHVEGAVVAAGSLAVEQKAQHEAIDERFLEVRGTLGRIEVKLDKIIEREITRKEER